MDNPIIRDYLYPLTTINSKTEYSEKNITKMCYICNRNQNDME